jgi:hypothetical protein
MNQNMPRLAEVSCSRLKFDPGDRLLVRTTFRLDATQEKNLRAQICKWAGCEVAIYIYCVLDMDIQVGKKMSEQLRVQE